MQHVNEITDEYQYLIHVEVPILVGVFPTESESEQALEIGDLIEASLLKVASDLFYVELVVAVRVHALMKDHRIILFARHRATAARFLRTVAAANRGFFKAGIVTITSLVFPRTGNVARDGTRIFRGKCGRKETGQRTG